MINLYIEETPETHTRLEIARHILSAMEMIGYDETASIVLKRVDGGTPIFVGAAATTVAADDAHHYLTALGYKVLHRDAEFEPEPDEDDEPAVEQPTLATQTALAFMAFGEGNPSVAVTYLATMARIDAGGPYEDALAVILATFRSGGDE